MVVGFLTGFDLMEVVSQTHIVQVSQRVGCAGCNRRGSVEMFARILEIFSAGGHLDNRELVNRVVFQAGKAQGTEEGLRGPFFGLAEEMLGRLEARGEEG